MWPSLHKSPPRANQNNLPSSQPFRWSLSTRGAEKVLSTGLALPADPQITGFQSSVRAVDRQKGRQARTHQPVAVAERHGRGFSQARDVSDVEAGPKQGLHTGGTRFSLPLHRGPRRHKAGIGPQPQVQVSAKHRNIVEETATGSSSLPPESPGIWAGAALRVATQPGSRSRRHHVGHQAALGVSAHRHRQDALGSVPLGPALQREGALDQPGREAPGPRHGAQHPPKPRPTAKGRAFH